MAASWLRSFTSSRKVDGNSMLECAGVDLLPGADGSPVLQPPRGSLFRIPSGNVTTGKMLLEINRSLGTVVRVFREASQNQPFEIDGDLASQAFRRRSRLRVKVMAAHFYNGSALEHVLSSKEEVPDRAKRIQIASTIDVIGCDERFGRHVFRSTGNDVGTRDGHHVVMTELFDEAEVDDLHDVRRPATFTEHDVAGLDVAMDQIDTVGLGKCSSRLA